MFYLKILLTDISKSVHNIDIKFRTGWYAVAAVSPMEKTENVPV